MIFIIFQIVFKNNLLLKTYEIIENYFEINFCYEKK